MLPAWTSAYVGLEFEERGRGPRFDCFGLCRAVWSAEFGLDLPAHTENYRTLRDVAEITSMIANAAVSPEWIQVTDPLPGDCIVFRINGQPFHVGVVVAPGHFLHVRKGINACVERWAAPQWSSRLLGFYRHVRLAEVTA